MPKVSVVMPTYNRPEFLPKAINSILKQTYQDFEIIIVDDGTKIRADKVISKINNSKIKYIQHKENKGGAAARNTGIKNAKGEYIAFLDDDDEWLSKKLETQMRDFERTGEDVGFCFSAVLNRINAREEKSEVFHGIKNFHKDTLKRFNGFLTVTLVIKKYVFDKVGLFDENFPSHQEPDLMIRISKKYKGLGVNKPLVSVNMEEDGREQVGKTPWKKIKGREMILEKYMNEYKKFPEILAKHYFWLAIILRDNRQKNKAIKIFKKAWQTKFKFRYFLHYLKSFL